MAYEVKWLILPISSTISLDQPHESKMHISLFPEEYRVDREILEVDCQNQDYFKPNVHLSVKQGLPSLQVAISTRRKHRLFTKSQRVRSCQTGL